MLVREDCLINEKKVLVMADTTILAASVKTTLIEIARQASGLGLGLQNAAPSEKAGAPNNSVLYLLSVSERINNAAKECEKFLSSSDKT